MSDHAIRVAAEIERYRHVENIHDLPDIFHYWSNKHLAPHVQEIFGTPNLHEALARELQATLIGAKAGADIVSIGAGDGWVEMALAKRMLDSGFSEFRFHCIELNPHLAGRGEASAKQAGLGDHIAFEVADLSSWRPKQTYAAAFAHHSLHHIEALEHVFDQVLSSLAPGGAFVISDMIGRNGHMRWPEALAPIERLWAVMPERYKFHHLWGRVVDPYENWDCSGEGFEGIRAQDIMPCLIERFHFRKLCVWGCVLDPFIDRAYGHNFDPTNSEDTAFIDRVWALDCALIAARAATPTQIVATMTNAQGPLLASSFGLTPDQSVRLP
jgi:SAM-dependent methyltransferase